MTTESTDMKRKPVKKSARSRNPAAPRLDAEDMALAKKLLPRGAVLYGILRSHASSGTRTIELVVASSKNRINRVWPKFIKAAGIRYNLQKDGAVFPGGGYSAMQEAAQALSRLIYGNGKALKFEDSYL